MTYEDRIAKNSQWREDAAFLGRAILEFHLENLPRIRQIIEAYPGKTRENLDNRKYGYLALVRHLKHFPDPDYMRWHIAQIPKETDKYLLSWMMCEIKDWPYLPVDIDITPPCWTAREMRDGWFARAQYGHCRFRTQTRPEKQCGYFCGWSLFGKTNRLYVCL